MNELVRVLIVDDDAGQREMAAEFLRISGFLDVKRAASLEEMWATLAAQAFDVLLLDYRLPDGTGIDALPVLRERGYQMPVVMVTGQGDERIAVLAMQRGAADYVIKSGDYLLTIPAAIRKALRAYELQQSVRRSQEEVRYQATLLNNVHDAIVVWNMEGRITYWNPAAEGLFGWSAADRLGKTASEVYMPVFSPPLRLPSAAENETPAAKPVTRRYINRNKQIIWVSSRLTMLCDAENDNRTFGYMDVTHDITQRIEIEDTLRTERNFVSAVLDTVGSLVVVLDRQGRIVRLNRACESLLGYASVDVRGRNLADFLTPAEAADYRAYFSPSVAGSLPIESENHLLTRLGEARLIAWSNRTITNPEGSIDYVIATGIDMTERRKAENALVESETRYRAMVEDYQTELIGRFTAQGILTFTNEAYCRYFNESREALLGTDFMAYLSPEDRVLVEEHLQRYSVSNPVGSIELRVSLAENEIRWLQWSIRAIFDPSDSLSEFQAVGRDVTDRKRAEQALQQAQTRLVEAARLATIGEMASGVAHQINNPLTTIIADAQILLRKLPLGTPGRDSVEAIEAAGWRLQEAVQRLVEFSRPAPATLESLQINTTIERALKLVGAHIEAVGIALHTELAPNLPRVRGTLRQMEDLWVNLLLLARDACNDGEAHTIRIVTTVGIQGGVMVEVQDDGLPLPAEQLVSIFEPNFIGPVGGRGTGMELSICREIVRQHGGTIQAHCCQDMAGQGQPLTVFMVSLPGEEMVGEAESRSPLVNQNVLETRPSRRASPGKGAG